MAGIASVCIIIVVLVLGFLPVILLNIRCYGMLMMRYTTIMMSI